MRQDKEQFMQVLMKLPRTPGQRQTPECPEPVRPANKGVGRTKATKAFEFLKSPKPKIQAMGAQAVTNILGGRTTGEHVGPVVVFVEAVKEAVQDEDEMILDSLLEMLDHAPRMSLNFADPIPWIFGAYHGSEVGFVFDVAQELHGSEHDLAATMAYYWTNFAAFANPSPDIDGNDEQSMNAMSREADEFEAPQSSFGNASTNTANCLNGGSGGPCPVVLDVRTEAEWGDGHVECAHRLPVQDNHQLVEQVKSLVGGDLNRLVVTYCYSGTRAGQAEAVLRAAGFTNVINGGGWVVPASNAALLRSLCLCTSPCALDEVPSTMAAFVSPIPAYNNSYRTPRLGDLHRRFEDLPTACEVLVRVIGSSVNPADRGTPSGSVVMGADISGRVVATNGVNCTRLAQGDAVWADIGAYATPRVAAVGSNEQQLQLETGASSKELGAYGQYALALETQLSLKPVNIDFREAGVLPKVALTTIKAYTRYTDAPWTTQPKVLVLGGSGGTGTTGIMLARHYGAGDIWTTSDNEQYCKNLGASKVINFKTSNWWEVVAPSSFDVIYDCVGQTGTGDHAMTALRSGGHYVTLRGALASHPRPDVTQNAFTNSVDNLYNYELLDELKHIVEIGGLRMRHIEEVFTLPHVADAFALSATGTVVGKLAISVSNWTSVRDESTPLPVCPTQYFTAASCLDGDVRSSIEFADDATSQCCAACRVPGWLTEQPECSGWRLIPTTPGAFNSSGNCTLFQGSTTPTRAATSCTAATKHAPPNPPPPPTPVPCSSQQRAVAWPPYRAGAASPEVMLALDTCNVATLTGYRGRFCDFWDGQSNNVPPA